MAGPLDELVARLSRMVGAFAQQHGLDLGTAPAVASGATLFALSLGGFATWGRRQFMRGRRQMVPLFPTPTDAG